MGMSTPHGYVLAVTRKGQQSDKLYALKIIMKDQLKEDNLMQTEQLEQMMLKDNPFLVKVIETFQDDKKIFILMEMMESGDLNYYRKQVGKFP
jgi:serine/threonine protein kinase